jgi:hypothetical protein
MTSNYIFTTKPIHLYKNNIDSSISFKLYNSYINLTVDVNKISGLFNKFNNSDCDEERYFFPFYNTSPGLPDWFKALSVDELKNTDLDIKPIIDSAFSPKINC